MSDSLPTPDAIAQAHSRELTQRILQSVAESPLPFSDYMNRCLYEPGLGYYMAGSQKFGADGDFVTSPEVSPLFGACLAAQCEQVLAESGGGVLELGAGSGRLALSVIQALAPEQWTHYWIVEPSAELQERQAELLRRELNDEQFNKLRWLTALPDTFSGVIVANEVMDALPVERLVRTTAGFDLEVVTAADRSGVATDDADAYSPERPVKVTRMTDTSLDGASCQNLVGTLTHIESDLGRAWAPGYCSEVSPLLAPWIRSLADALKSGAILLIDYGYPRREYYLEERVQGTLQCFYRHHAHSDVTFWPGLQDITAHVDFTSVIEAGDAAGLELLGYTSQAAFLFGCGLDQIAANRSAVWGSRDTESPASRIQHQQAINRLTLPGEMGERFQVMALGRGIDTALQGFSLLDLSHRL